MSWSSRKKKQVIFCTIYFIRKEFFKICVSSQCIVYWIHFQNIHIFRYIYIYKKNYFRHFCCLFLNSPKAFNVSLTFVYDYFVEMENDIFWNVLSSIFGYHLLKNFALFIVFAWKALRFTTAFLFFFFAATFPEYLLKIH